MNEYTCLKGEPKGVCVCYRVCLYVCFILAMNCIIFTERNAGILGLCGGEDRRLQFCGIHTLLTTHFHPPHRRLWLAYLAVCSNWPHRAQISLFRPAEACGRHAQAVGLVNLWDSSVRPKVSAPLFFTMTSLPPKIPLYRTQDPVQETLFYYFYVTSVSLTTVCVCDREFLCPHTPQFSILILLRGCDYMSVFNVC